MLSPLVTISFLLDHLFICAFLCVPLVLTIHSHDAHCNYHQISSFHLNGAFCRKHPSLSLSDTHRDASTGWKKRFTYMISLIKRMGVTCHACIGDDHHMMRYRAGAGREEGIELTSHDGDDYSRSVTNACHVLLPRTATTTSINMRR